MKIKLIKLPPIQGLLWGDSPQNPWMGPTSGHMTHNHHIHQLLTSNDNEFKGHIYIHNFIYHYMPLVHSWRVAELGACTRLVIMIIIYLL